MKKVYVLVIFALVVLNVFLWGVLVINNLNEKNNRLNETTTYKKQNFKTSSKKQIQKYRNQK